MLHLQQRIALLEGDDHEVAVSVGASLPAGTKKLAAGWLWIHDSCAREAASGRIESAIQAELATHRRTSQQRRPVCRQRRRRPGSRSAIRVPGLGVRWRAQTSM